MHILPRLSCSAAARAGGARCAKHQAWGATAPRLLLAQIEEQSPNKAPLLCCFSAEKAARSRMHLARNFARRKASSVVHLKSMRLMSPLVRSLLRRKLLHVRWTMLVVGAL